MLATIFAIIFGLIMGLAFTLYGLRVFLVLLPVWGFFAGLWMGAQATILLASDAYLSTTSSLVVGLIVGILFASLAYLNFEVGIALVTGAFGAALATGLIQAVGLSSGLLIAGLAFAVAVMLVWFLYRYSLDRYLVIVITSLGGSSLLLAAALLLFGRISIGQIFETGNALAPVLLDSWFWLLLWLAVAVVGIVVQIRSNSEFDFSKDDLVQGWS